MVEAVQLRALDWGLIVGFFAIALGVGLWASRRAGESSEEFFLGGRRMPWWMLGISMVATTFSTDTPNYVANVVRVHGVAGNWEWWAFLLTGMLTVFVYAKLWRRSGVTTDVELYELRYSGKPAAFLRAFRAFYLGVIYNVLVMAMVSVAAIKIGAALLGLSPYESVAYASVITAAFSMLGGFRGVLVTDCLLFVLAMVGAIAAAWYALDHAAVGGLDGLITKLEASEHAAKLELFPLDDPDLVVSVLVIPLAVQWWAAYYPGSEPGGGGYVVQRMLAAKDEDSALGATLLFNVAHYALRPWPWILVALCSLLVFPIDGEAEREAARDRIEVIQSQDGDREAELRVLRIQEQGLTSLRASFDEGDLPDDKLGHDVAYSAMLRSLPAGWIGLVLVSLIAAYMSTISTHLNWGSAYVVNDLYRRFVDPDASQRRLVWIGRASTVALMGLAALVALQLRDALQIFDLVILLGAGTGLLYILRWFWWRINAVAEIVAMVSSLVVALVLSTVETGLPGWAQIVIGVGVTTTVWIVAALVTPATESETLYRFIERINPGGPGWRVVRERAEAEGRTLAPTHAIDSLPRGLLAMVLGCALVYGALLGTGYLIYGRALAAGLALGVAMAGGAGLVGLFMGRRRNSLDTATRSGTPRA